MIELGERDGPEEPVQREREGGHPIQSRKHSTVTKADAVRQSDKLPLLAVQGLYPFQGILREMISSSPLSWGLFRCRFDVGDEFLGSESGADSGLILLTVDTTAAWLISGSLKEDGRHGPNLGW